jgi:hypothetical protein
MQIINGKTSRPIFFDSLYCWWINELLLFVLLHYLPMQQIKIAKKTESFSRVDILPQIEMNNYYQ